MADNFDFKQYLFENKLGAYSNLKEEKSITTYVDKQEGGEEVKVTITDLGDKINVEQIIGRIPRSITIPKDQLESAYAASNRGVIKLPDGKKAFLQQDVYDQLMGGKMQETVEEAKPSGDTIERMEGLVNRMQLQRVLDALTAIFDDLEEEGFDPADIKAFIDMELDERFWYEKEISRAN